MENLKYQKLRAATLLAMTVLLSPVFAVAQTSSPTGQTAAQTISLPLYYPGQLGIDKRPAFVALGNRLSVAGQERLVVTGTLSQSSRSGSPIAIQLVVDTSGSFLMVSPSGGGASLVATAAQIQSSAGTSTSADQALVNSIVQDSVEHYIAGLARGNAVRKLASEAKLVYPQNPAEPLYCDIFQVIDRTLAAWNNAPGQPKTYYFEGSTHLLASVFYQPLGSSTQVETRFANWKQVGSGQMVPFTIQRFENGTPVLVFTVQSAAFQQAAADNLFQITGVTGGGH